MIHKYLFIVLVGLLPQTLMAAEVIELEGIFVRGNQEQPKVLFITPWQTDAELSGLKQNIKPDLEPTDGYLDYFGFKRQVEQFQKNLKSSESP